MKRLRLSGIHGKFHAGPGWQPVVKVAWYTPDGRRHWSVTRLAAALLRGRQAIEKGYTGAEITLKRNGIEYLVTDWT